MDREKKLLYVVMVLAVIENALLLPAYQGRSELFRAQGDAKIARDCEARLIRTYKACLPKLHRFPLPRNGALMHDGEL